METRPFSGILAHDFSEYLHAVFSQLSLDTRYGEKETSIVVDGFERAGLFDYSPQGHIYLAKEMIEKILNIVPTKNNPLDLVRGIRKRREVILEVLTKLYFSHTPRE